MSSRRRTIPMDFAAALYAFPNQSSLLHNYLVLIRELRGEQRQHRLTLRGADMSALAEHLGTSEATVLGHLLDLMGATRTQRTALFAAGALTMVATGSIALNLPSTGAGAEMAQTSEAMVANEDLMPAWLSTSLVAEVVVAAPDMGVSWI